MKAIETFASFNENGEMKIENIPIIKNKKVKVLIFIDEEEEDEDFNNLSITGLLNAYADNEPAYDLSSVIVRNLQIQVCTLPLLSGCFT